MTIVIKADPEPLIDAVNVLVEFSQLVHLPQKVVDGLLGAVHAGAQIVRVDLDRRGTVIANELRVILNPSDFMVGFIAAVRALNGN